MGFWRLAGRNRKRACRSLASASIRTTIDVLLVPPLLNNFVWIVGNPSRGRGQGALSGFSGRAYALAPLT